MHRQNAHVLDESTRRQLQERWPVDDDPASAEARRLGARVSPRYHPPRVTRPAEPGDEPEA